MSDGHRRLGYVVGLLDATGEQRVLLPAGWWRPRSGPCELGLAGDPGTDAVDWIPCEQVQRVVWPNRLNFLGRLGLAIARIRDAVAAPDPVRAWPAPEQSEPAEPSAADPGSGAPTDDAGRGSNGGETSGPDE